MSKQFPEAEEQTSARKVIIPAAYSARIQEAMRYDKLSSSQYPVAMTIMRAVSLGYTEEEWKEGQQRSLNVLINLPADKSGAHAEAANRYEQIVESLKDLSLWPW